MTQEEVIAKISEGIKICSLESGIDKKNIRIKLSIKKGFIVNDVDMTLMNQKELLYPLDVKKILNLNMLEATLLGKYLSETLTKFAGLEKVDKATINARIATKSEDFTPKVYLFTNDKYIREITVSDLTG